MVVEMTKAKDTANELFDCAARIIQWPHSECLRFRGVRAICPTVMRHLIKSSIYYWWWAFLKRNKNYA